MSKSYDVELDKPRDYNRNADVFGAKWETMIGEARVTGPCKLYPETDVIVRCGQHIWTMRANKIRRMLTRGTARH